MTDKHKKPETAWWYWAANRDKQFLIAEKLGFYHQCSEEANQPQNYGHVKGILDNDGFCDLSAYYSTFEKCFNREMKQRFEHVNPTAGDHSSSRLS